MAIADRYASEVMRSDSRGAFNANAADPALRRAVEGRRHLGRAATVRRIWSVASVSMMPGGQYDRVVGKES